MNFQFSIFNFQLRQLVFAVLVLFFAFGFLIPANAAILRFSAPVENFYVGEIIPVKILVDTENETLNGFEIAIDYSEEFATLEGISDVNSIVNFWVRRDAGVNNNFTGVSIGGYRGSNGLIVQLNFRAKKIGQSVISFRNNSIATLHDGLGTEAELDLTSSILLNIVPGKARAKQSTLSGPEALKAKDKEPPEDFIPIIARSPNAFNNNYFLIFTTQDKGSGIDHYEVQEILSNQPSLEDWKNADSPHLLEDQGLRKYIFVKAVDRAGNEKIAGLKPRFQIYPWWFSWLIGVLVILILLLLVFVIIKTIGRKKENKQINGYSKLD